MTAVRWIAKAETLLVFPFRRNSFRSWASSGSVTLATLRSRLSRHGSTSSRPSHNGRLCLRSRKTTPACSYTSMCLSSLRPRASCSGANHKRNSRNWTTITTMSSSTRRRMYQRAQSKRLEKLSAASSPQRAVWRLARRLPESSPKITGDLWSSCATRQAKSGT